MQNRYKKRAEINTEPLQLQVRPVVLHLFLKSGADEDRESDDESKSDDRAHDSSENNRQFSCPTCDISCDVLQCTIVTHACRHLQEHPLR
jgi:hypothetical protein